MYCIYIYIDFNTDQSCFLTYKEHHMFYRQYSTKQNLQMPLNSTKESTLSVLMVSYNKYCMKRFIMRL